MSVRGRLVTYFILLMAIVLQTQAFERIAHVTSTYGELCYDGCEKRGYSYYYCHARTGWDYCSPSLNVDYKGYACKTDHPCGKYEENYSWCYNNAGSWGYCGSVERKLTRYTSSQYKKLCLDGCAYYASKGYFYCITSTNGEWDYCSPVPNVSYKNKICNADHSCGSYDEDYYWCNIGSSWDYCGLVQWDKCDGKALWKRQARNDERRNCIVDQGNNMEVNYIVRQNERIATDQINQRSALFIQAHRVIRDFQNGMLPSSAGSLVNNRGSGWRLDMQGQVYENGQLYYNLQLQLNIPRQNANHRTTYAIVLVPKRDFVHDAYTRQRRIRNALLISFSEKVAIKIEVRKRQARHEELRSLAALKPNFETDFVRGNETSLMGV